MKEQKRFGCSKKVGRSKKYKSEMAVEAKFADKRSCASVRGWSYAEHEENIE